MTAASKSVVEQGVRGLSIAAVLDRAQLSTRAFYRHFESKDQLVAAVFLELARIEMARLAKKTAEATSPVDGVVAWIDARLDLAFDENVKSAQRQVSLEAQAQIFASPDLVQSAYSAILEPVIEQLQRGLEDGVFKDIVPLTAAQSIQGVVWACTERQWATGSGDRAAVREHALRFCLRGLGVTPETIVEIAARV